MATPDPLESPKYLTVWANQQIDDFERQIAGFLPTCRYSVVVEEDIETGENVVKARFANQVLPVHLQGLAFNIANTLRSALDQTMFVLLGTGKYIYFPFGDTEIDFRNAINGWCKGLPKEIISLLYTFKAYKGGNNLLWSLNKMSNSNKHATVCTIISGVSGIDYSHMRLYQGARFRPKWDHTKNEMELVRFISKEDGWYFQSYLNFTPLVSIDNIDFLRGKPSVAVFRQFVGMVERIIMTLERESRRIGIL